MIEKDTVRLLRECDAGVKMGIDAIRDVLPHTHDASLKNALNQCKHQHEMLENEINGELYRYNDTGKEPKMMAKNMSRLKTGVKLAMDDSDKTVAELMTDGCNMGVKSLNQYLNRYKAADEKSKDIAKRLINMEQKLTEDVRKYL